MSKRAPGKGWLERPQTATGIVRVLVVACGLLLLADLFYEKHPHFGFDGWFGFYAFFGLAAYCFIVLSARGLRRLISRDENYYDEGGDD